MYTLPAILLLLQSILHGTWQGTVPGASGGGGGALLSDSFVGTTIDTGKWIVHQSGGGSVAQNNGVTITGDGTWGHAVLESVLSFDRSIGDVTMTVKVLENPCQHTAAGAVAYGDWEIYLSGKHSMVQYDFGTVYVEEYNNATTVQGPATVSGYTCSDNVERTVVIKVKATGCDVSINGGAVTSMSAESPALGPGVKLLLASFNGPGKFTQVTVTQ